MTHVVLTHHHPDHAINVALYSKLGYDLKRDFAPISTLVTGAYVLVVHPSLPAMNVQQLIQLAKAQPRKLNFSSFGEGGSAHLTAELFKRMAGIDIVHVPYKGGGPAITAVVGGEVQMTFANLSVALPQVKAGKVKALAVTSLKRRDALSNVPSLDEIGLKGFDATAWVGLLAPAKTPRAIVLKVNRDVRTVLTDAEVRRQLELRALRYKYTDEHPPVQRLAAEVDALERQTIPALVRTLVAQLRARDSEFGRQIDSAGQSLRELPAVALEEARLVRNVSIAEAVFTGIQTRFQEASIAEASTQGEVKVLDYAARRIRLCARP